MDSDTAPTLPQGVTHQKQHMESDSQPKLPESITHQHQKDVDIIAWSNKNYSYVILLAILIVGVVTLYSTFQIFTGALNDKSIFEKIVLIVFIIIMWAALVGILVSFFSLTTWGEAIHISDDKIILRYSGKGAPKPKLFNKKNVMGLAFRDGRYHNSDTDEMLPALNIFYARLDMDSIEERKETFAIWMKPEDKYHLFLFLRYILKTRGWQITYRLNNRPSW